MLLEKYVNTYRTLCWILYSSLSPIPKIRKLECINEIAGSTNKSNKNDFKKSVNDYSYRERLDKLGLTTLLKSKVGDFSRGWPEGSFFNSYYTKV